MDKFAHIQKINIENLEKQIKIAGSEDSVSHTIETLLELNKLIPERWDESYNELQEGQLASTDNRWEEEQVTERQLEKKDSKKKMVEHKLDDYTDEAGLVEKRFDDTEGQRRPDSWDLDDQVYRGHKNVPPIWQEVYRKEDAWKKTDKGQLDKKK